MQVNVDNRPLLPFVPYVLLQYGLLACLVAMRLQSRGRVIAFLTYASILSSVFLYTTGDAQMNYATGCTAMGHILIAFHLLCLSDPLNDFRHEHDKIPPREMSYARRVYWAFCVIFNSRGVGSTCQIANVPPRSSEGKWTFVRQKLLTAFRWFLVVDLTQTYHRAHPLFSRQAEDIFSLATQGHVQRCINIFVCLSSLVAHIGLLYALPAAIIVALGISEPRDWPDMYGRWSDAYTVRRFWGRTYHQLIRRFTASIGKAVCRLLGLRTGSRASSNTQLYVGFAVSGIMHCGGDLMVSRALPGLSFPFFFAQAVAISLEDAVIHAGKGIFAPKTKGARAALRWVGYAWVFAWLSVSAPLLLNWWIRAGVIDASSVPFSLIGVVVPGFEKVLVRWLGGSASV
ncbi:uncharacterized protein LAESUDRAFT_731044 [Laetiporus sulphureus 93-53]|uniref:Wax synthase domain-containing protein n=1 Tax=Laetiporus sulphureus 93-53 TaxID=1314785 RepID=A0A165BTK2_9APHY|nr:uncharacterized protein LAESUDRAFT_731044 [Laetiporus sulphureus 93-53]KZT01625.1 hypothetical protein LAESUDRAFT_731044 [Laetiporus sulphureus 93-53]